MNKILFVTQTMTLYLGYLSYDNTYKPLSSVNIGDYVQTLAALNVYKALVEETLQTTISMEDFLENGIKNNAYPGFEFIEIQRDNMSNLAHKDKKIFTIMNGWMMHPKSKDNADVDWPPPSNIVPIIVSFHVANCNIFKRPGGLEYLRQHGPVGCRDYDTLDKMKQNGVQAYFSGCLTQTIDFYRHHAGDVTYLVDVVHRTIGDDAVAVKHCVMSYRGTHGVKNLKIALELLKQYASSKQVITSRLHCYLPCVAMGVPVRIEHATKQTDISSSWGDPGRFRGLIWNVEDTKMSKVSVLNALKAKIANPALPTTIALK